VVPSYATIIDKDYTAGEIDAVLAEIRSLKEDIEQNIDKQMQEFRSVFMSMSGNPSPTSAAPVPDVKATARQELQPNPQRFCKPMPTGIPSYYTTARSPDNAATAGTSLVTPTSSSPSFTTPGKTTKPMVSPDSGTPPMLHPRQESFAQNVYDGGRDNRADNCVDRAAQLQAYFTR
jgi:hypothetical protein